MSVLQSNNWEKFRPQLIILETVEYVRKGIAKKTTIDYSDFFTSI
jgi:hypothetical protein